jgi:hypothetical protein
MNLRLAFAVLVIFASSTLAHADVKLKAVYSESANIFDVMDNVSNWWDGFCEEEYQKFWTNRYGISDDERVLFSRYKQLRERYYSDPDQAEKDPLKNRNGFFATSGAISADPLAEAFYSSSTLTEAMAKVEKLVSPDEFKFLKTYYEHFQPKYSLLLQESTSFASVATQINKSLSAPKVKKLFDQVANFYDVHSNVDYRILFVWWPPINRANASPTGSYLLMRYNPMKHLDIVSKDSDIVFHEVVHTISARQPLEQKQRLTKQLLQKCDQVSTLKKLTILEEPLAVAIGQMLFLERVNPSKLHYEESLYSSPWISAFAKLIFPVTKAQIESGKTINDDYIEKIGAQCVEMVRASAILNTSRQPAAGT